MARLLKWMIGRTEKRRVTIQGKSGSL